MLRIFLSVIILVPSFAFAKTIADDSNKSNLVIDEAYTDGHGGTIVRFAYQSDYAIGDRAPTPNPKLVGTNLTFYCSDNRCDQLQESGSSVGDGSTKIDFESADGAKGKFIADKKSGIYKLKCESTGDSPIKALGKSDLVQLQSRLRAGTLPAFSLPDDARSPEYGFRLGEEFIYVDSAKYNSSYDSFRFYTGPKGHLAELKVKRVSRMRDGGTTNIVLEDGRILHSPTPFSGQPATFDGKPLEKIAGTELSSLAPRQNVRPNIPRAKSPCPAADRAGAPNQPAAKSSRARRIQ